MVDDASEQAAAKAMVKAVFSEVADVYGEGIDFFGSFGRALISAADLSPGMRVLDLACGRGACLFPAIEAVGPSGSVIGVDLAEPMVALLDADLARRGVVNASVRRGDAEALAEPDRHFDAVTGGFMIFFTPDPRRVLAEAYRVLRPGGIVAFSTFDGKRPSSWLTEVAAEILGVDPEPVGPSFDDAPVLDAALMAAGFETPAAAVATERFVFATIDEVEAWHRSHFARQVLDRFDEAGLRRYREEMARLMESDRVEGGYQLVQEVRLTVARKA